VNRSLFSVTLALGLWGLLGMGCGGEAQEVTQQRGMSGVNGAKPIQPNPNKAGTGSKAEAGGKAGGGGSRRSGGGGGGAGEAEPETEPVRPDRPRPILTRENFSGRARDPFHNYAMTDLLDSPEPIEIVRKQRDVKLAEYTFDELRLIAIVNAGRNVAPTALFLASDNKSKSIKQGEYFSSAEVLLASVNRDYIEVEIIDPELTPGWNLERGERKVIYLKER
jgi:Tfp pilus assembly protein PilP